MADTSAWFESLQLVATDDGVLGTGTYGEVRLGVCHGRRVAVKTYSHGHSSAPQIPEHLSLVRVITRRVENGQAVLELLMLAIARAALALYGGDHFVRTVHSFSDIGSHSTSFFALEFFASWCGHCQDFAPVWKQAARQACAAVPRLEFVAVDCASDYLLCQEMRVASFPTIRLFGPGLPSRGRELSTCQHGCKASGQVLDELVRLVRSMAPSAVPARSSTDLAELSERSLCAQAAARKRPAAALAVHSSGLRQGEAPPAAAQARWPAVCLPSGRPRRWRADLPPPSADACAPR